MTPRNQPIRSFNTISQNTLNILKGVKQQLQASQDSSLTDDTPSIPGSIKLAEALSLGTFASVGMNMYKGALKNEDYGRIWVRKTIEDPKTGAKEDWLVVYTNDEDEIIRQVASETLQGMRKAASLEKKSWKDPNLKAKNKSFIDGGGGVYNFDFVVTGGEMEAGQKEASVRVTAASLMDAVAKFRTKYIHSDEEEDLSTGKHADKLGYCDIEVRVNGRLVDGIELNTADYRFGIEGGPGLKAFDFYSNLGEEDEVIASQKYSNEDLSSIQTYFQRRKVMREKQGETEEEAKNLAIEDTANYFQTDREEVEDIVKTAMSRFIGRTFQIGDAKLKVIEPASGYAEGHENDFWIKMLEGKYKGYEKGEEFNMKKDTVEKYLTKTAAQPNPKDVPLAPGIKSKNLTLDETGATGTGTVTIEFTDKNKALKFYQENVVPEGGEKQEEATPEEGQPQIEQQTPPIQPQLQGPQVQPKASSLNKAADAYEEQTEDQFGQILTEGDRVRGEDGRRGTIDTIAGDNVYVLWDDVSPRQEWTKNFPKQFPNTDSKPVNSKTLTKWANLKPTVFEFSDNIKGVKVLRYSKRNNKFSATPWELGLREAVGNHANSSFDKYSFINENGIEIPITLPKNIKVGEMFARPDNHELVRFSGFSDVLNNKPVIHITLIKYI